MVTRRILIDVVWLILSLVLTTLLALFLFGQTFLSGELDLHLHDTYFVISRWLILTPLFLLVTFIIFFIRTFRNKFEMTFSNWILLLSGLLLVIALTILIKVFSQFTFGGWTMYPPLSALGPDQVPEVKEDPVTTFITNFLTVVQAIVLVVLAFATFRWGTLKHRESNQQ